MARGWLAVDEVGKIGVVKKLSREKTLPIGYVPLVDCAPLVMAHEQGFFQRHGLNVTLKRELGWAVVRHKIIYGELDAAIAPAAMPLAAALGFGSVRAELLAALIVSLNGNGVTLSRELAMLLRKSPGDFRNELKRRRAENPCAFGISSSFSSHRHLLELWLSRQGIDPNRDVRIVVAPPSQMTPNLKSRNLDGFCSGEPWNSAAEAAGVGECVSNSGEIEANHPGKAMVVRRSFAEKRPNEHLALICALMESCEWCADPANHKTLINTLARREYLNVPGSMLERGVRHLCCFPDRGSSDPSPARAAFALESIRPFAARHNEAEDKLNISLARSVFRVDLHEAALKTLSPNQPPGIMASPPRLLTSYATFRSSAHRPGSNPS